MAKVVISPLARADMREIGEYIRRKLHNPGAAAGLIRRYLIFYHTDRTAVMVDRVLYGRRDYLALLFGDKLEED